MKTQDIIIREQIIKGETRLGIEFGSTRIKAVLVNADCQTLAVGSHSWENQFVNQVWTYPLEAVWAGLADCYRDLKAQIKARYDVEPRRFAAMGVSGMMHGYMAFGKDGQLLSPFRTWRNTMTGQAAEALTALFHYNIPQRWSIAHLYQSILNSDAHVAEAEYLTTLAGYVHWQLTDRRVLGINDASGMFPIDPAAADYDASMLAAFDDLVKPKGYPWTIKSLLPQVLKAGEPAGSLTEKGARLLDPSGALEAGVPFCPPEGDAGTGMVATNSVEKCTGNVSAGTSIFAMIVLEKSLSKVYPEADMVMTPAGDPVAMVHCNNGTSELDGWIGLFREFAALSGKPLPENELYTVLLRAALEAEPDGGGLIPYNYLAGEQITQLTEGRPLFLRTPESRFTLRNFMRAQLYSIFATLKLGMNILADEHIRLTNMTGHGGLFKVEGVAQRMLAAGLHIPVTVMANAGEGGPWGEAVLASYMLDRHEGETLAAYLQRKAFKGAESRTLSPEKADEEGFDRFLSQYERGLEAERAAVAALR